ncbi:DUF1800 domain-containing protein [Martelella sp. HB161492]|uniref:DUF1800 domain-containing protein n=1 Tax=Martelella sp. HB161492 TaxID=2720726 RepID=UPI0015911B3A|nr:DUF1800 domain-containing protein [Martelella sp. HB161492]
MPDNQAAIASIRFGYGLPADHGKFASPDSILAMAHAVARTQAPYPVEGIGKRKQQLTSYIQHFAAEQEKQRQGSRDKDGIRQLRGSAIRAFQQDRTAMLADAVTSSDGFGQRLVRFWSDHFSIASSKVSELLLMVPLFEAESIRPNIAGQFGTLLRAATLDPAMLIYLDQTKSMDPDSRIGQKQGRGINENLGRELLELHTLGAGSGYTQDDVRQTAYLLAGLTVERPKMRTVFDPARSAAGPFTVMGQHYATDRHSLAEIERLLTDLAVAPQTARTISRKLAVHFISDQPDEQLVSAMAQTWLDSGGALDQVYAVMLRHPSAWSPAFTKAKQPCDYLVSSLRALTVSRKALAGHEIDQLFNAVLPSMGQAIWDPPSPEGFDERRESWITAHQLAARLQLAQQLTQHVNSRIEPAQLAENALGPLASASLQTAIARAPSREAGRLAVLASPQFNQR